MEEDGILLDVSALFDIQHQTHDYNKVYSKDEALAILRDAHGVDHVPFWLAPPKLSGQQLDALLACCSALVDVCSTYGVDIFADGGTLLGAIRHEGMIPWDDDMDFGLLQSQCEKFKNLCLPALKERGFDSVECWYGGWRLLAAQGKIMHNYTGFDNKNSDQSNPPCTFPFIDIFIMKCDSNGYLTYSNPNASILWKSGLVLDDLYPLNMYKFDKIVVPGPRRVDNHLNSLYGSDWATVVYDQYDHYSGAYSVKIKVQYEF